MATAATKMPLETGDRLTRDEFERRYKAMAIATKAELIEGVVYMASPIRFVGHGEQQGQLMGWLGAYQMQTPGARLGGNSSLRLDLDNELQPDGLLIIDPACGGQARIDEDGYIADAPEWVGEVAASSASYDLHIKLDVYRRNGVREYLVWRVFDQAIDWFTLRAGRFERLTPTSAGIYQSEVFPGLWLDAAAMINGDLVRVHEVLQQGLRSAEHAAFVLRLQEAGNRPK